MRAVVQIRSPDGQHYELSHGDIIGRLWSVAMPIDDARVSEAHAMLSLRGREMKLLALRGLFAVDGRPVNQLVLQAGQTISLARGVEIVIEGVALPDRVLAVEGDGLVRQIPTGVCALVTQPEPHLIAGYRDNAAILWSTGNAWRLRLPGEAEPRELNIGDQWVLDGRRFRAVAVALTAAGEQATRVRGSVRAPLTIITRFDTVHFHRDGQPVATISGISARIISALAAVGNPISWEPIAAEIWGAANRDALRRKWDVNLVRLRKKLQAARIRTDLIRADGNGNFELVLYDDDQVDDQS
ncbi:MAG: hypothetical protein AAFV53_07270 [Myxococcota bacterium]